MPYVQSSRVEGAAIVVFVDGLTQQWSKHRKGEARQRQVHIVARAKVLRLALTVGVLEERDAGRLITEIRHVDAHR